MSCSIITKNKANELKIEFEAYDTATLIAWDGSISKPIGRTVPTHVVIVVLPERARSFVAWAEDSEEHKQRSILSDGYV